MVYAGNVFSAGYPQISVCVLGWFISQELHDLNKLKDHSEELNLRKEPLAAVEPGKWIQGSWKSFPTLTIPCKTHPDGWDETWHLLEHPQYWEKGKEVEAEGIVE